MMAAYQANSTVKIAAKLFSGGSVLQLERHAASNRKQIIILTSIGTFPIVSFTGKLLPLQQWK
jgi:hypothetical protein